MPAIWGSLIGGGLGLASSLMAPDEQTTTSQNYPSPFLTGRPGRGPGGFDPAFGDTNLLGTVNQILGRTAGGAFTGAGREGQAQNALFNRGLSGNPLEQTGTSFIQRVLGGGPGVTGNTQSTAASIIGGQGLNPSSNPYLQQTFNRAADLTRGRLASEFAGSGRDLGASQPARSDELQTLASNIFGGNYQAERGRQASLTGQSLGLGAQQQMGALNSALPFANQDFTNITAMLQGAGNPIDNLINRVSAIAPAAGGTATVSQPVYSNPLTAGLGGAAVGSQVGGALKGFQWPWGGPPAGGVPGGGIV